MSDNNKSNSKMKKLLYTEAGLLKVFGTVDVDIETLRNYTDALYMTWENNQLRIPYNATNLSIIIAEKKKVGGFEMTFSIEGKELLVKTKLQEDLTYLKLKYNF